MIKQSIPADMAAGSQTCLTREPPVPAPPTASPRERLSDRYRQVRGFSERLCETLEPEDYVIQTMPEMSPTKWHMAHTSWFFETFVA